MPTVYRLKPMRLLTLVWINVLLIGCASNKETVLPQAGPTMQAIYQQHMNDLQGNRRSLQGHQRLPKEGIAHYRGFVREAANEIDTVFPRLPNPTLVMYVFPHLSHQERTPVPGYATTFPFYERVEYALPGEIPGLPPAPGSVASEGASQ